MCCKGCLKIIDWFPEVARRNLRYLAQIGLVKDRKVLVPCPRCGHKNWFEMPRRK